MRNMKKGKALLAAFVLSALNALSASALVIEDNYTGGVDEKVFSRFGVSRDVIGGDIYQVYSMDVTNSGSQLSVTINTDFISSDPLNTGGFLPGDLFISVDGWTPYAGASGAPYHEDNAATGTSWEYAFDSSAGSLLKITDADIDLVTPEECCRIGQEVLVTGGADTGAAVSYSGPVASLSGLGAYQYTYVFDFTALGLNIGDEIGLHWTMTCGNDVIEGAYQLAEVSVPEPGTAFLLGIGVVGLVVGRRRIR